MDKILSIVMQIAMIRVFSPDAPGLWLLIGVVALALHGLAFQRLTSRQNLWIAAARWTLIPYVGLISGALSPRFLGIAFVDWQAAFGAGALLLVLFLALLAAVVATVRSPLPARQEREASFNTVPRLMMLIVTGVEQFQWTFFRGGVGEAYTLLNPGAALDGSRLLVVASALMIPELLIQRLAPIGLLFKVLLLITSAAIYLYTQNFWLCWVFHLIAWSLISSAGLAGAIPFHPHTEPNKKDAAITTQRPLG